MNLKMFYLVKKLLDTKCYTLAYFHQGSVTSCKKIKKDCDKKDCEKNLC